MNKPILPHTLDKFRVYSCGIVDMSTLSLIRIVRASCITGETDSNKEVAELRWEIEKLVTALELRNEYVYTRNCMVT